MRFQSELSFDAGKIYFFGMLIALLYGLSPLISSSFFGTEIPLLHEYLLYFVSCAVVFLFMTFPINRVLSFRVEVSESRLIMGMMISAVIFVMTQIAFYGDFKTAFIVAYTERTGVELSGGMRFIFYPVTTAFISIVLLFSTHLYLRRDRINLFNLTVLGVAVLIFAALGSRNLLLWGFSAVLALVISRLRFRSIAMLVAGMYLFAVIFAYARNNGLIAYLTGNIDQLYSQLSWQYFDPMIQEFGSSYRTFVSIYSAKESLANAPYGQLASFFVNQLPSFMKPANFIGFTDYISLTLAEPGEGIGSSPMTEAYLSDMTSLFSLATVAGLVFWPAYYFRKWPAVGFFTYTVTVAVCFNVWRIGSAEILKMFLSSTVASLIIAKICGFRILRSK